MTEWPREFFIDLEPLLRIRCCRSDKPPIRYAIMLEAYVADHGWTTIRLWDNSHGVDEHHEHRYTRTGGKQEPVMRTFTSTNQAMAAAIKQAESERQHLLDEWSTR